MVVPVALVSKIDTASFAALTPAMMDQPWTDAWCKLTDETWPPWPYQTLLFHNSPYTATKSRTSMRLSLETGVFPEDWNLMQTVIFIDF